MIAPLLLAAGLALPPPQEPLQGDLLAPPRIFTMSFQEALKVAELRAPERIPVNLGPLQQPASHLWLRFAMGFLANDSFERWELDPREARGVKGQPSWSWTRFNALRP